MGRIARATSAAIGAVVLTPWLANAEPVVLTASQMDSVTAAALVEVNVPVNVSVQTNITTQVANAVALAFATCGVCVGRAPTASSAASALNFNLSRQTRR